MATIPPHGEQYLARVADGVLRRRLRSAPAVLIEGPRACGKTTTARQLAASEVLLERSMASVSLASLGSLAVLDGAVPRLIDEWQLVPDIWDMVRRECDRRGTPGQFILTGSADPPSDVKQHSGVGRVARVQMRPLSLLESGLSTGAVSLHALFDGTECSAPEPPWDLGDYCQPQRAELSHYRDNTGLEVDTIIRRRNGEWIAAEIKLGGRTAVDAAAASLLKLRDRIDPTAVGEPRRLVVITATGFAYERTDGVAVAPITSLGP